MRTTAVAAACGALSLGCALLGPPDSPVVAEAEGFSITLAELDAQTRETLLAERTRGQASRLYDLRSDVLEAWIEERILSDEAERRGLEVDAMLEAEAGDVTQEEVQALFDQNAARLPEGTQLSDVESQIRAHLRERKIDQAVASLVAAAGVQIHLEPPRIQVAAVGPSLGPDTAPVTIIEFSDFQCPFCKRVAPVMKELRKRYPEDVRIVYRHLPLESIHPRARPAAEASACAEVQGRFWEFHDQVFANPKALADADLRSYAEETGLDLAAYDACVADGAQRARVSADLEAGREAGISGTPAFLVNGVLLSGAQPLEAFERLIERELKLQAAAP